MTMRRRNWVIAGSVTVVAVAVAVTAAVLLSEPENAPAQTLPAKGQASRAARADVLAAPLGRFGFALLDREAAAATGNVVISPASIQAALSMLANGARGETLAELRRALDLDGIGQQAVNQAWADLITAAQTSKKSKLAIADSLWLRNGVDFKQPFIDADRDYYAAQLDQLKEDPQAAADAINRWVDANTHGKITRIVGPVDPSTVLALVNTVYLKVGWTYFHKKDTSPQPFTLADGTRVDVPMMFASEVHAPACQTPAYDAVMLKTNGSIDTWVIVPNGDETPETVARSLEAEGLAPLYRQATEQEGTVSVPRLSLRYQAEDLKGDLEAMGVKRLFVPDESQLDGIAALKPLYVQDIVHKATLDLDEEGVEAAAATGVIVTGAAAPGSGFQITADHPFLVVLTEHASKAPLFMAMVRDPR